MGCVVIEEIIDEIGRHLPTEGEARRVFHGRGRCFPGLQDLTIDAYGSRLWITLFAARDRGWLDQLVVALRKRLPEVETVVVQHRDLPREPLQLLLGQLEKDPILVESGLKYYLRPHQGLNIGFFIDMAIGRSLVRQCAGGKRVLNLFAYSCSFSVAALAGGAEQVVNIDMNRSALDLGRRNHRLNALDERKVSFLPHEIFRSFSLLRKLGPFDLIVCDPPHAQGRSFTAEHHWPRLIGRLESLLAEGGEVIACLNAPHLPGGFLHEVFRHKMPHLRERACLTAGEDFPEADPTRGLTIHHFS